MGALVLSQLRASRARRLGDDPAGLALLQRLPPLFTLEHTAFAVLLASGAGLMWARGWSLGYPRWLGVKLGLVVFLAVPLEGMHAYVVHAWMRRGLRQTAAPPFSKDLRRGLGMEEMIRTLSFVLLGAAVPLLVWLSVVKPF